MNELKASLREEWVYRYQERLGILCGAAEPTKEQHDIAYAEADAWLAQRLEDV